MGGGGKIGFGAGGVLIGGTKFLSGMVYNGCFLSRSTVPMAEQVFLSFL